MMKFLRTQMKWIMAVIVIAFLLSTFLMYEGRGTRRTPSRNPDGSMADYEVAQINGRSLMRSELEQRLRNYLSTYSTRSVASIDMPAIYRSVLDEAILESQLAKEVQEKGITVSDAEADQAMKSYADTYFPTREAFYQVLANSGLKPEDYKRSLARQMASERLIREAVGEITVSEDKVSEFYDTMKNILYIQPEGYMIHMADFSTSGDAEKFRAMLAAGASWDATVSGDSLASMDVINITRSPVRLPASTFRSGILSVLASVDVGQASPVFTVSSNDYGVALKVSHVDASNTPFDEVSGDIRTMLSQQEERNRLSSYESSLRAKASVVINDEELFASTAASQDKSQSADILPIMSIEEEEEIDEPESEDEAIEDEPEEEEPEESAEPVAASEDKTAETPAPVVTVSEDEPAETPAPVAVSEDTTAETPEPVTVSEDTTAETPEPVTVSEDTPAETPAPVEPVTEAETPEPVATASEDTTAVAEAPSAEEAPAPVEQSADTETPAPIEALSEDTPAVTVTEASPDIQQ